MRSYLCFAAYRALYKVGFACIKLGDAAARQGLGADHPANKPAQLVWPTLDV
jgi:hypothetical protein